MDFYKPICKYLVIPLWARWERSPYLANLNYLELSQYYPLDQIREWQWTKIKSLLYHAYEECAYYRRRFDQEHLHPDDIKNFDDYRSVPILTKQDVNQYEQELYAPRVDKYISFLTSGSTGRPLHGYRNKESSEFLRAAGRRSDRWAGCDLGDRIYCLYGNPERELSGLAKIKSQIRRRFLNRTETLDMLQMTEESMLGFAQLMRKRPPALLWGHAHGLYLLASFLKKEGVSDIQPKGIYSAGMVLHPWERRRVEEVFQCRMQDRYGTEELGLLAAECKAQEGLHINTDCHYMEFIGNDGRPVAPGEQGMVVVTDLMNTAMPFIRYKLEDLAVPSSRQCSCGRTQPLIDQISGRIADFLITPEGKLVSGISLTDHFAGHIPGVVQIQIVQDERDCLTINIVKSHEFTEESKNVISRLVTDFFGVNMNYRLSYKDQIPLGRTGKYRFTICNVKHEYY